MGRSSPAHPAWTLNISLLAWRSRAIRNRLPVFRLHLQYAPAAPMRRWNLLSSSQLTGQQWNLPCHWSFLAPEFFRIAHGELIGPSEVLACHNVLGKTSMRVDSVVQVHSAVGGPMLRLDRGISM